MPTITVVLRDPDEDGKMLTERYPNAEAHVNPTTNLLQVYRRHGPSGAEQELLAEFHTDTYLYWE